MADLNFSGSNGLLGNSNNSSGTDGNSTDANGNATGTEGATQNLEPIENKHNDLTKYWDVQTGEQFMNSDTPSVKIYISHEKPEESEDEEGETHTVRLEEYIVEKPEVRDDISNNPDIKSCNTTVIKRNRKKDEEDSLAINAIDDIDFSTFPSDTTTVTTPVKTYVRQKKSTLEKEEEEKEGKNKDKKDKKDKDSKTNDKKTEEEEKINTSDNKNK